MIIAQGNLSRDCLAGQTAIVTGAGGGIGFETARALIWLGAKVIIAEIQEEAGKAAEESLIREFGEGRALFVPTDVGDESSIHQLTDQAKAWAGGVDIVINNATIAPLGAVKDVPIDIWDDSYRVNLRGPVLMAQTFLPDMVARHAGVFICVTSKGSGYMGAYETFKMGQEHLADTLADELEGSGVKIFIIGPGFSPTSTADSAIPRLAEMMNLPEKELRKIIAPQVISIEAAGAGFAAAAALANRFHGLEIASLQALHAAGIDLEEPETETNAGALNETDLQRIFDLSTRARTTLAEQAAGWKKRSIFEQQWMIHSFKKHAGAPVNEWLERLEKIEAKAEQREGGALLALNFPLQNLASFYHFLAETAKGYVKTAEERDKQVNIVLGWQKDVDDLNKLLTSS